MKLVSTALSLVQLLAPMLSVVCASPVVAQDNTEKLLQNGGFEEGDDGVPVGWSIYPSHNSLLQVNLPYKGDYAAKFTLSSGSEGYIYQDQDIQVIGGKSYKLSGWAFIEDDPNAIAILQITWYESTNGTGESIRNHDSNRLVGLISNPEYCFLTTGAVTAPPDAHSAKVKAVVRIQGAAPPATVYFDDLSFVGAKAETPSGENGEPADGSSQEQDSGQPSEPGNGQQETLDQDNEQEETNQQGDDQAEENSSQSTPITPEKALWQRVLPPVLGCAGVACIIFALRHRKRGS